MYRDNLVVQGVVGPNEPHKNLGMFVKQLIIDLQKNKVHVADSFAAERKRHEEDLAQVTYSISQLAKQFRQ